jgi:hypothetical protein
MMAMFSGEGKSVVVPSSALASSLSCPSRPSCRSKAAWQRDWMLLSVFWWMRSTASAFSAAVKPLLCRILNCLRMVDLPHSPAPSSSSLMARRAALASSFRARLMRRSAVIATDVSSAAAAVGSVAAGLLTSSVDTQPPMLTGGRRARESWEKKRTTVQ